MDSSQWQEGPVLVAGAGSWLVKVSIYAQEPEPEPGVEESLNF